MHLPQLPHLGPLPVGAVGAWWHLPHDGTYRTYRRTYRRTYHTCTAGAPPAACASLPLARQVDVGRDAALQLHEEIRTLQSKQG